MDPKLKEVLLALMEGVDLIRIVSCAFRSIDRPNGFGHLSPEDFVYDVAVEFAETHLRYIGEGTWDSQAKLPLHLLPIIARRMVLTEFTKFNNRKRLIPIIKALDDRSHGCELSGSYAEELEEAEKITSRMIDLLSGQAALVFSKCLEKQLNPFDAAETDIVLDFMRSFDECRYMSTVRLRQIRIHIRRAAEQARNERDEWRALCRQFWHIHWKIHHGEWTDHSSLESLCSRSPDHLKAGMHGWIANQAYLQASRLPDRRERAIAIRRAIPFMFFSAEKAISYSRVFQNKIEIWTPRVALQYVDWVNNLRRNHRS